MREAAQVASRHLTGVVAGQVGLMGHWPSEDAHEMPAEAMGQVIWLYSEQLTTSVGQLPSVAQRPSAHLVVPRGQVTCEGQERTFMAHSPPGQVM